MLFQPRKDILLPMVAPSGTGAQTIRFIVKQERRRLVGFTFRLSVTCAVSAATGAAWGGIAGIVKEIRLVANDGPAGGGQRNVVQVTGPALLSFIRQLNLLPDRHTQVAYASGGFPAGSSQTLQISYYVPLKHPSLQEPFANVTAYPLSSTFTANDLYIEVDLWDIAASGTVFTANPVTYASSVNPAVVQTHLSEIPDSFPYIRSEWRTDTGFSTNATANVPYEFTSGGFLTGALIQTFSGALGNTATRSTLLSTNGQLRVEYGREVLIKTDEAFQTALNDSDAPYTYPNIGAAISSAATPALDLRMFPVTVSSDLKAYNGEYFFDFLSDQHGGDVFSLASCPDLNTDALGGDKFRFVFNDLASSSRVLHITYHKLLSSRAQIVSVLNGFANRGVAA